MLSRTFRVKEKVQVLNAVTSIWESAVILSLISDWCVKIKWSDWPGSAIFSVPEDRKENATAWNIRKFTNTMILVSSTEGGIREKDKMSFNPRRLRCGLSSSTTLSCPSAQFVWSTNFRKLRGVDHQAVATYTLGTPS